MPYLSDMSNFPTIAQFSSFDLEKIFYTRQAGLFMNYFFFWWRCDPTRVMASSFLRFLDHTRRRTTAGRTPLDKYQLVAENSTWQHPTLTTDKHPCPTVGFEPTISAGERPQTYALDRGATGTGVYKLLPHQKYQLLVESPSRLRSKNISAGASRSITKHKNCILFRKLQDITSYINCRYGHSHTINSSVRLTVGLTVGAHKQTFHPRGMLQHTGRSWSMIKMWKHWGIPNTLLNRLQLIFTCSLDWNQQWRGGGGTFAMPMASLRMRRKSWEGFQKMVARIDSNTFTVAAKSV